MQTQDSCVEAEGQLDLWSTEEQAGVQLMQLCPVLLLPPGTWLSFCYVQCDKLMSMAGPCSTQLVPWCCPGVKCVI